MEEPAIHKVRAAANVVRNDVPAVAEVMDQEVPSAADVDMGPELTELSELDETFTGPPRAEKVPNVAALDIGPELRELPKFGEMIAGPPRAEEEEKEHFMTVGCDPDGDEPAGADEEWRYFKNAGDANVQPIKNVEVEVPNRKRSRPMPYFDTEAVPNDEAGLVDDCIVADTTYDKENPVIKEGHTFVDKAEFMEIIRTYAIKNEFQSKIEHSDSERSKFSKECKVDYVNNNISECFNNWIKDEKELPAVYLMDKIREKIMVKIATRKVIAEKLEGRILPSVLHELNMKSRGLHYDFTKSGPLSAEISGTTNEGKTWRKAKAESLETSSFVVDPKVMSSPGVTTRRMASLSPASPGVTTRRMASLSPASPGVTTRRMASISPGGINRRLIIE
ncbi:hypothetical protein ACQ4PT_008923 [Festuca glaucescens]